MPLGGNVRINGTALDPQPSRVEYIPPRAPRRQMPSGGFVSAHLTKGWRFRLTFGNRRIADDLSLGNLRTRLGAVPGTATIAIDDHAGATITKTVLVDEEIGGVIEVAGLAGQFTIELVEGS